MIYLTRSKKAFRSQAALSLILSLGRQPSSPSSSRLPRPTGLQVRGGREVGAGREGAVAGYRFWIPGYKDSGQFCSVELVGDG